MYRLLGRALTRVGVFTAHPAAFLVVVVYVGAWFVLEPGSFGWHEIATVATWLMTLIIQRAEHRDTQAIHAKLDELLRVNASARSELAHIDEREPEAIEVHREQERAGEPACADIKPGARSPNRS